jgi:hypothetical protein
MDNVNMLQVSNIKGDDDARKVLSSLYLQKD